MKFNAMIGDSKGADLLVKSVHIMAKLCPKICVIRLAPDDLSFVTAYNVRNGVSLEFKIPRKSAFVVYNMEGVSPEANAIYFEMPTADLLQSVVGKDFNIKLKLIKKDGPHLKVELVGSRVIHEIPITLIPVHCWSDYDAPDLGLGSVMVAIPSVRVVHKIVTSMKNIGGKTLTVKANNSGEMCLGSGVDAANVDVYIRDLNNITLHGGGSDHGMNADEYFPVSLDLKLVHTLLGCLHNQSNKLLMKIVSGRAAIFCFKQQDCQFRLTLAGLNTEEGH